MRSWASIAGRTNKFFFEDRSKIFLLDFVDEKGNNANVDAVNGNVKKIVKEDDFLDLLYGGELQFLEPFVQGYKPEGRGAFKVTFKTITEDLIRLQNDTKLGRDIYANAKGVKIHVRILNPRSPTKTVTLRPVPLEYPLAVLEDHIINQLDWGTPTKVSRGLHKQIPSLQHPVEVGHDFLCP